MKQRSYLLLALLSILILMTATTTAFAEEGAFSGQVEVGLTGMDLTDSPARVNEYVKTSDDDDSSVDPTLGLKLESVNGSYASELDAEYNGSDNYDLSVETDLHRIFKLKLDHQSMQHWKDHDTLEHIGATMAGDIDGDQPRITSDATVGELGFDSQTPDPVTGLTGYQTDYLQELSNDYIITREETEAEADLTIPALPNVTFHAGLRIETREGLEQARTLSKCSSCHVHADAKNIDEKTEDFTFGATGKFGQLTVDYEYLARDFEDDSGVNNYNYLNSSKSRVGSIDWDQMLYIGEEAEYGKTPDSEKDSHMLKARYDFDRNTVISGSYVSADIESTKEDLADNEGYTYQFVGDNTLESAFESLALKGATRIGNLRLSLHGTSYEIEGPEYTLSFPDRVENVDTDPLTPGFETSNNTFENPESFESAESREVSELGFDAVYRLAMGTTVRFSYDYEEIDRAEDELGDTKTSTIKLAANSRLAKGLNIRASYEFQDIDEPFVVENGTGIAQGHPDATVEGTLSYLLTADYRNADGTNTDPLADGNTAAVYYWNTVYPSRGLDATDQPENVHEAKINATWSPAANMALTGYLRTRFEKNDEVDYQEDTFVPGFNFWYAPNNRMNLSMAYNFNKMKTENRMCVGWYHG